MSDDDDASPAATSDDDDTPPAAAAAVPEASKGWNKQDRRTLVITIGGTLAANIATVILVGGALAFVHLGKTSGAVESRLLVVTLGLMAAGLVTIVLGTLGPLGFGVCPAVVAGLGVVDCLADVEVDLLGGVFDLLHGRLGGGGVYGVSRPRAMARLVILSAAFWPAPALPVPVLRGVAGVARGW